MREQTLKRLKELVARPPEALGGVMERMDRCEDIAQWEGLHLEFALAMGRELFVRGLQDADPPPGPCPHCEAPKEAPPPGEKPAGVSPPRGGSSRGGARRGRR